MKVVGTSVDPVPRLQKFRDKYELKFLFASDLDRSIGLAYGTLKGDVTTAHKRDTFVVDREGRVLLAYQRVGAHGHAATVLNDTRRLRDEGRI